MHDPFDGHPPMTGSQGPASGSNASGGNGPFDAAEGRTVDVGRLLDEGHWSAYQKLVLALVSLTIVLDGLDQQTLALSIPTLMKEWGIGRGPFGLVLALSFVTMAIGTVAGGMLGDRLGRRFALLTSMVVFGGGTLAGAFADDLTMLGLTRVIASLGLGAAMPNATAMAAEYTPLRYRTLALGLALGSVPIGAFLGGVFAAYILPSGEWRNLFILCGLIPLGGAVLLAFLLPESIRFLLGRPGSAPRIASLLHKLGHPASREDHFIDSAESHADRVSVGRLFAPAHRRDTLILSAAFFLIIFANLFVVSWTPALLADMRYRPDVTSGAIALWSIGGLVGALAGALLFAKAGSRMGLSLMTGGAALIALVLCLAPLGPAGIGATALLSLMLIGGFFIPGTQVLLFALAGQVYPTTIRATGVGFAAAVGRVGAVLSGLAGPLLLASGSPVFFALVAAVALASGILLLFMRSAVRPSNGATGASR